MICRFGGHSKKFYSVAEHSINVSKLLPKELKLWGLLHDSPETYIQDIVSPVKRQIFGYKEIETKLMLTIGSKFNLYDNRYTFKEPEEVKKADLIMLTTSAKQLMSTPPEPWQIGYEPINMELTCMSPDMAEQTFLQYFYNNL